MTASSHLSVGIMAWALYETKTGGIMSNYGVHYYLIAALGSLLPDIDHPKSWLGGRLFFLSFPLWAIFGHRGITHSLLAILAMVGSVYFFFDEIRENNLDWLLPLIIGYLSHLFADYLTNSGIPLFYPVKRRIRSPLTVKTGSMGEYFLVYAMAILFGYYLSVTDTAFSSGSISSVYEHFEKARFSI